MAQHDGHRKVKSVTTARRQNAKHLVSSIALMLDSPPPSWTSLTAVRYSVLTMLNDYVIVSCIIDQSLVLLSGSSGMTTDPIRRNETRFLVALSALLIYTDQSTRAALSAMCERTCRAEDHMKEAWVSCLKNG